MGARSKDSKLVAVVAARMVWLLSYLVAQTVLSSVNPDGFRRRTPQPRNFGKVVASSYEAEVYPVVVFSELARPMLVLFYGHTSITGIT